MENSQLPKVQIQSKSAHDPRVWDIVVLGAGVAGSALAYKLGQDGRRVLCVERDLSQPDRIVGELLQPGGYQSLKSLGLADCVEKIDSQKVYGYSIINKDKVLKINYPLQESEKLNGLSGRSFHHGRFIQKLRLAANSQPLVTMREGTGQSLLNVSGDRWEEGQVVNGLIYRTPDGEVRKAHAHLTIVCDGMYSAFRNKIYSKSSKSTFGAKGKSQVEQKLQVNTQKQQRPSSHSKQANNNNNNNTYNANIVIGQDQNENNATKSTQFQNAKQQITKTTRSPSPQNGIMEQKVMQPSPQMGLKPALNTKKQLSQPKASTYNSVEARIQKPSRFAGLILSNANLPNKNMGHVLLAEPSPILLYPISSTEVRCLVDIPEDALPNTMPKEVKKFLTEVTSPQIPVELQEAFMIAVSTQNIKVIQNKQMPAKKFSSKGLAVIGDAYNMRHPLTGGGMSVALNDCNIICDMIAREPQLSDVYNTHQIVKQFHAARKPLALTINSLAFSLYKVFAADESEARKEMQLACFDYLSQGGNCAQGPVSLLSGLNPKPQDLFYHFFCVAFFACNRIYRKQKNFFQGIVQCINLLYMSAMMIIPVLLAEGLLSYALTSFYMLIYVSCKRATEVMMLSVYSVIVLSLTSILKLLQLDIPSKDRSKFQDINKSRIDKARIMKS